MTFSRSFTVPADTTVAEIAEDLPLEDLDPRHADLLGAGVDAAQNIINELDDGVPSRSYAVTVAGWLPADAHGTVGLTINLRELPSEAEAAEAALNR